MKAASLWEPWASAMYYGFKRNETRSWPTSYRGPLLICAAKRPVDVIGDQVIEFVRQVTGQLIVPRYGMGLCVVDVIACEHITAVRGDNLESELGDYTPGRFAWITANLRRCEPFPVRGAQGLFDVPDAVVKAHMG